MSTLETQFRAEAIQRQTANIERELARLKEAHPEVNFFWLEMALTDTKHESDELVEEFEYMEGVC